jgi:hypothetical protein
MTSMYLKMRIATLEFEMALLEANILEQNAEVLKTDKRELETRLFVIELYPSQAVSILLRI